MVKRFKMFQSFNGALAVASSLSFLLAMVYAYSFLSPRVDLTSYGVPPMSNSSSTDCNLFEGRWIRDDSYPLYNSSLCPFAERGFNCLANGRRDQGYTQLRWSPNDCAIPKFNPRQVLEKLRGKRIVFVGDSLSRTQWESLTGSAPRRAPKRVKSTLKLDKMDDISNEWIDSDVLIFNSGHWWTPSKLFDIQGLLFPSRWIVEAWNAYKYWFPSGIRDLGYLGC